MLKKIFALSVGLFIIFSSLALISNNQFGSHLDINSSDSLKNIQNLQYSINSLMNDKNLQSANYGLTVYSITNNKFYYKRNSDRLLTPASNTKLFTSFACLSYLGENFNTRTSVYCNSNAINGAKLNGNIYLYGRGDINFGISDIEELAQQIKNFGINEINGNICADASFFDTDYHRKSYSGDNEEVEATGPIYPISIEKNLINVLIKAGSITGKSANIQIIPTSNSFVVRNNTLVGYARKKKGSTISVRITTENQKTIITVSGTIPPKQTGYYSYFNNSPALTAAGVLKERLAVVGIKVNGEVYIGKMDKSDTKNIVEIANYDRPITDIMYWVNKKSDNFLAEMLFKIVGGNYAKYASTAQSAREIILKSLDTNGIARNNFVLNDGCGLSRRNLVSSDGLVQLLVTSKRKSYGEVLDSTLAIAGVDGTLRKRMIGTTAEKNLRAKTGTLRNVSSLAGYVRTLNGELLAFAFIFNGPNVGYYKQTENKIGEILANFQYLKY